VRKINENNDIKEADTNEIAKFYYTILKERQNWLMGKMEIMLKSMTALIIFDAVISVV